MHLSSLPNETLLITYRSSYQKVMSRYHSQKGCGVSLLTLSRWGVFPIKWPWICYPSPLRFTFPIFENRNGTSFTGRPGRLSEITEVKHWNCLIYKFSKVAAYKVNKQRVATFSSTNNEWSKKVAMKMIPLKQNEVFRKKPKKKETL